MSGSGLPDIGADGLPTLPAAIAALELEAEHHEDAVTTSVLAAEARMHAEDKRKREEKLEAEARNRDRELQVRGRHRRESAACCSDPSAASPHDARCDRWMTCDCRRSLRSSTYRSRSR